MKELHCIVLTCALLLLWAVPSGATAQPTAQPTPATLLTLDEAVQSALRQRPSLKEAEAAVSAAEAEVRIARSAYFPQLSFDAIVKAGLSGTTGALGLPGFPASPYYRNVAYSANWYQSVFDFGRIKHNVAMQHALYRSAQLRQTFEQQRTVLEVKVAYFSVLEAQQMHRIALEIVKEEDLEVQKATGYESAGLGSDLDKDIAEARLAKAHETLTHSQSVVATAMAALRVAMGDTSTRNYILQVPAFASVSPQRLDALIKQAIQNRPDEQAAEFKVAALKENLGFIRSQRLPYLSGFGAAGGGRFNGTSVPDSQRHGVAALGIIVPIFTGGRLKAEREEALAELKGTESIDEQLRQQIGQQVTNAWYQLSDLKDQIDSARQQEISTKSAVERAHARYRAGLGSYLEVLTAQTAYINASELYTRAQVGYEMVEAQMDFAVGANAPGP